MKDIDRRNLLVELYQEMYLLTEPACAACPVARPPQSCCADEWCEQAAWWAKKKWGVEPKAVPGSAIRFLGPHGCTLAPHLRPLCTVHTCEINKFGCKVGDPAWTNRYVELRDEIELVELNLTDSEG